MKSQNVVFFISIFLLFILSLFLSIIPAAGLELARNHCTLWVLVLTLTDGFKQQANPRNRVCTNLLKSKSMEEKRHCKMAHRAQKKLEAWRRKQGQFFVTLRFCCHKSCWSAKVQIDTK